MGRVPMPCDPDLLTLATQFISLRRDHQRVAQPVPAAGVIFRLPDAPVQGDREDAAPGTALAAVRSALKVVIAPAGRPRRLETTGAP